MSIQAILFDCDGTLMDTEAQTDQAIRDVMRHYGVSDASLPTFWTRGCTWKEIALRLQHLHPQVEDLVRLEAQLTRRWDALVVDAPPLPGALEALREAKRYFPLALVTGSPEASVAPLFKRWKIGRILPRRVRVCADHVTHSKPNPEGFQLAAQRLGLHPRQCLVFEDSRAGLLAARAAGSPCVAVLETAAEPDACRKLADWSIQNYLELPPTFWRDLSRCPTPLRTLATQHA